jgi:hypothetical protein
VDIKNRGAKADVDVLCAGKTVHLSIDAGATKTLSAELAAAR